ncbi:MAG: phenylalanine--tRNA ligase subunit beta, partial [Planctomycetes bacterium]|nr:phenylalanine--tRNA ligase subunit beta [Planctomycetota bacterium]
VTGAELKLPDISIEESDKAAEDMVYEEIAEPELCKRYTARIIDGIKVGPSPDWMKNRLEALGLRSVNNVVDATNYAMLECGQPPHAFDYAKISDGKIIVRKAKPGERIVSIDGSKCELDNEMLIIADSKQPVAIAGVMGGLESEVSDETTTILLEEAHFDPVSIRTTSRKLGISSDASFRFERVVDVENIDWASRRCAQLIAMASGGKVLKGVSDCYPTKPKTKQVKMRLGRLKMLLGIDIPAEKVMDIFTNLKFSPQIDGETITCTVPSWRSDIYREADLIEEAARIHGYDNIPLENKIHIEIIGEDKRHKTVKAVSSYLNSCGYYETINVTFVDGATADVFSDGGSEKSLSVKDVSRKSANLLRQNLIGSLFSVLKTNVNAKNQPCRIFEIADTFAPSPTEQKTIEKTHIGLVTDGDFRQMRGVIEGLVGTINKDAAVEFVPAKLKWAQAGAEIKLNGKSIGSAGLADKSVLEKFDIKDTTASAAEIELEALCELIDQPFEVKPIPRFPAIRRDLSILIEEKTSWAQISDAVGKAAPAILEKLEFVDIYRGKGVETGKKSLTLSLVFRDEDGTLTHEIVDGFEKDIVKSLSEHVGAELRTA